MVSGFKATQPAVAVLALIVLLASFTMPIANPADPSPPDYALVIHGGAGVILRDKLDAETEQAYRTKLLEALETGREILAVGGSSLDAVEAVINLMEDSPLFNAGRGSVFTEAGKNEMDASIMTGHDLNAGAVAGVTTIKNPISAARRVMTHSKHVMLSRDGAEAFAADQGLEIVDPEYFRTERRWESYRKLKAKQESAAETEDTKHGTVGCVALDREGNIAAGTSTGGMTMKKWGRIGDSPVIGAGTYANNLTCGVSATGHGEFFIRNVVAHDISALMEYKGLALVAAADLVVKKKLVSQGATGGIVALDGEGNIAMSFNTPGMYRGFLKSNGEQSVFIFGDE
ncbi:MAG: isoaspartyl peptidase/L-asparaginase [Gemmatimonadales bacterium]|nr:isoaspartyl peptidase/L-asparaginase [Gemmatimonadales bacterium]